jgi:chromosome segregation ATPase
LIRDDSPDSTSPRLVELQNQVRALESERQHSLEAVNKLLADLTDSRSNAEGLDRQLTKLETTHQKLETTHQKQLTRLRGLTTGKLILPFGRRQQRLRELLQGGSQK